ncbi:ribosome-inactivating protein bryodin I-like, partial [Momordica charantia]|uniref:rRNA N-glycosylase n=1 Tax=Momordica charantia TaxID=3673 RepID=A0A6J1DVR9_MOMCH
MRKLLVFSLLILTIFLASPTVEGDVSFNLSTATKTSYGAFLNAFRADLPLENKKPYNISLLRATVAGAARYTRIHLTDRSGRAITLAIDVTNVYLLGFYSPQCNISHFFNDPVSIAAKSFVFTNSKEQKTLPFDGSYPQLAGVGANRSSLVLGLPSLNNFIPTLAGYNCPNTNYQPADVAKACVVTIQTMSEAARFQKIQDAVPNNLVPNAEILSLENNWGKLSKQVQLAESNGGRFKSNVTLQDPTGATVIVSNVNSPYVRGNIRLLLNQQNVQAMSEHENYATMYCHWYWYLLVLALALACGCLLAFILALALVLAGISMVVRWQVANST